MKRTALALGIIIICSQQVSAQIPEDAIRMSWQTPSGTARSQAIGGAMGSLGGEITTLFVNPAGLGFYKRGEFVFTPGFQFTNGTGSFRGTETKAQSKNSFNFGTTGAVFSWQDNSKWRNKTFAIGLNRTANFNNFQHYSGQNDYSSFSEQAVEDFANSGLEIDQFSIYDAPLQYMTKLAYYTYLIDTIQNADGSAQIVGAPQYNAIKNNTDFLLNQDKTITTKGGITELALGFASNMDDMIYIGGSLGIPIVNYSRTSVIREEDATGDPNNSFRSAVYQEDYDASGLGVNAKLGLIFKPVQQVRVGLAIHSPSWYALREKTTGSMVVDHEGRLGADVRTANQDDIYTNENVAIPDYQFDLVAPWKFLVSGTYTFNAVEDVTQQKGFISADIEYVTHRSSKFRSADPSQSRDYYDAVNAVIKDTYKGAINYRVGGEMKFNTVMARLGFAYYGSPYKEKSFQYGGSTAEELKPGRMNVSGGLGYRNRGIFVDLTYVHSMNRDINFPYRLADKDNTFAGLKENNGNVILTVGLKFR